LTTNDTLIHLLVSSRLVTTRTALHSDRLVISGG